MKDFFNWLPVSWSGRGHFAVARYLALALMLGLPLAACGPNTPSSSGRLKVVATFSILGDMVRQVAGDNVELRTLVGPDGDTHTFEPTSADAVALANADLIFEDGLGFETWLDRLYSASESKAKRVVVTAGVEAGQIGVGSEAGALDPHAWQDVSYAMQMVSNLRDALSAQDPPHAGAYQAAAAAYLRQLQALDADIQLKADSLPPTRRKLVTNHDALGYFARRYGFEIVGSALGSVSTEASQPSAAELARLTDEIKSAGVPAIFTENIENNAVISQAAQEAGVKVAPPLYTDALGPPGTAGETYIKMMRYNIETIVTALK